MARITMQSFGKRFKKETHFKKPLGRTWTVKLLEKHLTKQSSEWGGVVTKYTSVRDYDNIIDSYENVWYQKVNTLLKSDTAVKNDMLTAMGVAQAGAAQAASGTGYIFWTKDRTGDNNAPGMQGEYDALTQPEQERCTWLQETTTEFHNYYVDNIVGRKILSGIKDKLASARAGGNDMTWTK